MNKIRQGAAVAGLTLFAAGLPLTAPQAASVFDGYFQQVQERNAEAWSAQDQQIDAKRDFRLFPTPAALSDRMQ